MLSSKILIINGPNLNLLGIRETDIYGTRSFDAYFTDELLPAYLHLSYYQSNHEGDIIDKLQSCVQPNSQIEGVVLNAGAYTHTSLAIADAVKAIAHKIKVVEVHISNIYARQEEVRHKSFISPCCMGSIVGFGLDGYRLAIEALLQHFRTEN